jgi:uncharacterized protein (TIGR02757 family)
LIKPDPLQFVYRYSRPRDMEIAGFLASALAYGRVQQIEKSVESLLLKMGDSPYEFVVNFDKAERKKLSGFWHRFTSGDDISDLLELFRQVLLEYGSIEKFFVQGYSRNDKNIVNALTAFCDGFYKIYAERNNRQVSRGLKFLLAGPDGGSASKRLNLFLRWMVRKDDVDAGLWRSVDKAKLIVPIDVHMGRLCKIIGLYDGRSVSLSSALKITAGFAMIEPGDPAKYDFALSRIGIVEDCNGRYRQGCEMCELFDYCLKREQWL